MIGGNPNSIGNGLNDSRVSAGSALDSLSKSDKENVISKRNDPNAYDGVNSASLALGMSDSELNSSK